MYNYSISQWLLFFYIYCFIGWIWESCYVSVHEKKWVNRGFLHGPFLPIYGTGAIAILWATLPVANNYFLIFLFGMISATILEYFTGALMEKIFKVRYWDYTNEKFNLNGHICLKCSLAWGVFSILMIKVIHHPINNLVLLLPHELCEMLALVFSVGVAIDATTSFREAMDLKDVINNLANSSEEIKNIQKHVNELINSIDENKYKFREAKSKGMLALETSIENGKKKKDDMIKNIHNTISEYLSKIENEKSEDIKLRKELEQYKEKLKFHSKLSDIMRKNKTYKSSMKILKRNPHAVSKRMNNNDK